MRVGVVGLGKLGLPVALTLERAGHNVMGWDADMQRRLSIGQAKLGISPVSEADHEPYLTEYLAESKLRLLSVTAMAAQADILLVCVQTPHEPDFEGVTPLEREPQDFDYSYLRAAVAQVADTGTDALVVIVSTCLPGTFDREIRPLCDGLRVAYHPLFIAMGSVVEDFRNPEFVLVGYDLEDNAGMLAQMYWPLHDPQTPWREMSITSAELTKVAYNAAIGYKLMLANGIAELADRTGADCDDVMGTLMLADKRIVSPAYMTPGMGDGGGCHPRDQIALSWLADTVRLSHDPFGFIIRAREAHAEWLADMWLGEAEARDLEPIMLGEAYKANTTLTTGSHALLVAWMAGAGFFRIEDGPLDPYPVACYFLATPHDHFLTAVLPAGSVVVDPWGVFPEREGVEIVRPGRRPDLRERQGSPPRPAAVDRVVGEGGL